MSARNSDPTIVAASSASSSQATRHAAHVAHVAANPNAAATAQVDKEGGDAAVDTDDEYEGDCFDIPNEAEDDLNGAYLVWSTLLELILELHEEWDDHDMEERKRRAKAAADLGKNWANAVRRHSKYTCVHYYCHIAFAHLEELILCNGHLFCGDDAVLERGHQSYKRLRTITSSGGKPRWTVVP